MRDGQPSRTAQGVAASRRQFERLLTPFGDPAADDRLATDVAGPLTLDGNQDMMRYLRARTAFFDRVVVNALGRNVRQVVSVAAGYDGRALRYAKPGVRWFEVDHPDTQADKLLRLERLGIGVAHVAFIPADLARIDVASPLLESGWRPDAPSLCCARGWPCIWSAPCCARCSPACGRWRRWARGWR